MTMEMIITKNLDKKHVIAYQRDDGTQTWIHADEFFIRHDLAHFAVETIMEYRSAFLGMLNAGMDIGDFADREKRKRIEMTNEAAYAENMANLFLTEISQGQFEDFNVVVRSSFIPLGKRIDPPVLRDEELYRIRKYYRHLLSQWEQVGPGGKLSLTF